MSLPSSITTLSLSCKYIIPNSPRLRQSERTWCPQHLITCYACAYSRTCSGRFVLAAGFLSMAELKRQTTDEFSTGSVTSLIPLDFLILLDRKITTDFDPSHTPRPTSSSFALASHLQLRLKTSEKSGSLRYTTTALACPA